MRSAIILLAVSLFAGPAMADKSQSESKGFEQGGEFGFLIGATFHDDDVAGLDSIETEPVIGLRGGAVMSPHLGWFVDTLFSQIDSPDADAWTARAGIEYLFNPQTRSRWFISFGGGFLSVNPDAGSEEEAALASLGFGQRWRIGERKILRWELRGDHTIDEDDFGENVVESHALVGLNWGARRSSKDGDGDGVADRRDLCPDTPRGAEVDEDGCPMDSDKDGVPDGIDACPDTPYGWPVDGRGCPKDGDGDGVPDGRDDCPNTPAGVQVGRSGCPLDTDGDGVPNGRDQCPNTPRGVAVDRNGCALDADGDGVPDHRDECPGTPAGTPVRANGCPKAERLFKDDRRSLILEGVLFHVNSDKLTAESRVVLDRVAQSLIDWPKVRVEIAGHTDSSASEDYNLELSTRRAESVRKYLVDKGVATDRLVPRGYGEGRPIANNETRSGKARNRRVELTRIE